MKTHENADPDDVAAQIDFCWDIRYLQMNQTYSDVYNNHTPQQAWRAGFREGVKMSLDRGSRVNLDDFKKNHWKNLNRMYSVPSEKIPIVQIHVFGGASYETLMKLS